MFDDFQVDLIVSNLRHADLQLFSPNEKRLHRVVQFQRQSNRPQDVAAL